MQVSTANNVKVYNLSAGKSLPEWISDRKKRTLLKNDVGESVINYHELELSRGHTPRAVLHPLASRTSLKGERRSMWL